MADTELDFRQLDKAFKAMDRAGADLRPVWRELRRPMRAEQSKHFSAQRGPDGPWAPLAASTRAKRLSAIAPSKRRTKKGRLRKPVQRRIGRILSRKLIKGARLRVRRRLLMIAQGKRWAAPHQHGATVGHGARLPAREYLWIGPQLLRQTVEAAEKHLVKHWRR